MRGAAQCFGSAQHVLFRSSTESGDGNVATFGGDSFDRSEVAVRRDRETRFDDVDAERLELVRQPRLLVQIHRAPGRLLAIAQRRVEDFHSVSTHSTASDWLSKREKLSDLASLKSKL